MKKTTTAREIISSIQQLEDHVFNLYDVLQSEFPQEQSCDNCLHCQHYIEDSIYIPNWAKEAAGLTAETKLEMFVEEDSGRIILEPQFHEFDITDMDEDLCNRLVAMGICLGELNNSLINDEVIYES